MEKLLPFWFDASLQGVAFVEPVRNSRQKVADFRYRHVNTAFAQMLRRTKGELIGQIVQKAFQATQEDDFFLPLLAVLKTGEAQQLLKLYQLDGQEIWLDISLTRTGDLIMVNVQDVSEQKNSELDLQRHLAMESIVSTISSRFISLKADEVDACIPEALGQISEHIDAERASVFLYSKDYQEGYCLHEWCASGIGSRKNKIQTRPRECFDWMRPKLENGEIIRLQVDQLSAEEIREKAFFEFISVHSMIAVPLVQEQKTQGFIGFYTINRQQTWDQNDVSLLETFSSLIANVLYRLQQEEVVKRANHRLEGLHAVDQALLNYRLTDQPPLSIAMNYMHFMVPCNRITVSQINEDTGQIVVKCQVLEGNLDMNPDLTVAIPAVYEQFLRNHEPNQLIYYPDLKADSAGIPYEINPYLRGYRSLIFIPLYRQKEYIGSFSLLSVNPYFFTEEYQQIAQELAGPLAIVLYQQQLDEQLRQYTEHLEQRVEERAQEIRQLSTLHQAILRHAGQAIISTDINGVIQTANQASEILLGYRVDELIGQSAHLELGPPENPVPFIAYRPNEQPPPINIFADALAFQGYFHAECIVITKTGEKVPILLAVSALQDSNGVIMGYVGISTDISALKTAEIRLQQKNQELNTFFDVALDLHCILNAEGRFLKANRAWEKTLGYSIEELSLLTCWELQHPDEQEAIHQLFRSLIDSQPIYNQIHRLRKKDGTYRVIEWSAIGIENHIYASAKDITERQQAENQMVTLNQRLQLATQAAGQGIWENDLEKGTLFWDDRLWELHGLEPRQDNWDFQEFTKLIHPDDLPTLLKRFDQDLSGHKISDVIRIIRQNDGAVRYFETNGLVIHDEQGKPVRAIGVVWDVTDRKLAEVALQESEQRFREIAENVDEVFWVHSAEPFRLLYINPACERVWNTTFQQLNEEPLAFMGNVLPQINLLYRPFLISTRPV
ncbi:PAS domain S-box protein [Spirosoma sp. HMF3257]|uniref:histidine kinase n=1 Tax=Spirosoma telluris TaxID=2183553 RepID=A0A327NK57_9BACT|nr:PAS domain S-box protein [Spirosoma telluris]RAI74769.1 histidine kinase [Spirosoma telluris]